MAYNTIYFKNPFTGQLRKAPVGYSWTCLFFGFADAFYRNDWKWLFAMALSSGITGGFLWIVVYPFIYNKLYIQDLINNGYKVVSIQTGSLNVLASKTGLKLENI
jgi:hypothetical protein